MENDISNDAEHGSLPNFLVIGATKCGTESLHAYLCGHPDVYMSPRKELRYFSREHNWTKGAAWYKRQFASTPASKAIGESSNSYTRYPVYPGVPARIHALIPDAKLIYLIRHPLKRIESHYRHRLATGVEWRQPDLAISQDPSYVAASLYGAQLRQYLEYFDLSQILVIRLEDLVSHERTVLERLCRFLGIGERETHKFPRKNLTADRVVAPRILRQPASDRATRKRIKQAVRSWQLSGGARNAQPATAPPFVLGPGLSKTLTKQFQRDVETLTKILGRSFDDWTMEQQRERHG